MLVKSDGKVSSGRLHDIIEWPAPPDETLFVKPYLVSLFPPNSIPTATTSSASQSTAPTTQAPPNPSPTLQIRSTLHPTINVQTLPYPFSSSNKVARPTSPTPTSAVSQATHTIRLLTPVTSTSSA